LKTWRKHEENCPCGFPLLVIATVVHAELWPTLDHYVSRCTLIVLCETGFQDDKPVFKVIETWKGTFDLKDFNAILRERAPGPNYLPQGLGLHSGRRSNPQQKCVFFFTGDPKTRPYDGSSTSFDVRDGKLTYAETGNVGEPKEYTLKEFKAGITKIIADQATLPATPTAK
jgi:hypothetical protein